MSDLYDIDIEALLSEGLLSRAAFRYPDHIVHDACRFVDGTGLVGLVRQWKEEERQRLGRAPGGRPIAEISDRAMWVALVIAAFTNRPLHFTVLVDILYLQISEKQRRRLGLSDPPSLVDTKAWERLHRNIRHRFHSFIEPFDPSPLPKNRCLSPREFEAAVDTIKRERQFTDDVIEERNARLALVANTLLEATVRRIPKKIRKKWRGDLGVDATPMPLFSRGETYEKKRKTGRGNRTVKRHAADADGGYYVRTDPSEATVITASGRKLRSGFWACELSLAIMGSTDEALGRSFPRLVVGMAPAHRPALEPGLNALIAAQSICDRGHPVGRIGADRAYTQAKWEKYQGPSRQLGYEHVLDYRMDQLGVQGTYDGAKFIEGRFYCPLIPDVLASATIDFRNGVIDAYLWDERLAKRQSFEMRRKASAPGGSTRYYCPAEGTSPRATCDRKPNSQLQVRKRAGKTRIPVSSAPPGPAPKVCGQKSITIPADQFGKLRQELRYQSPEWRTSYAQLRNTIEGVNGLAKDGAYEALGDSTRRRIRGVAAQSISAALLLAATNMRKIRKWIASASTEPDGESRVPRRQRKSRRQARTNPVAQLAATGSSP